jgi:hypothetical protein
MHRLTHIAVGSGQHRNGQSSKFVEDLRDVLEIRNADRCGNGLHWPGLLQHLDLDAHAHWSTLTRRKKSRTGITMSEPVLLSRTDPGQQPAVPW